MHVHLSPEIAVCPANGTKAGAGGLLSHIALGEGGTEGHVGDPPGWWASQPALPRPARAPPAQPGPHWFQGVGTDPEASPSLYTVEAGSLARVQLSVARHSSHLLSALPGGLDRESPALLWGQAEAASPIQTLEAAPLRSGAPTWLAAWSGSEKGNSPGPCPCSRPPRRWPSRGLTRS